MGEDILYTWFGLFFLVAKSHFPGHSNKAFYLSPGDLVTKPLAKCLLFLRKREQSPKQAHCCVCNKPPLTRFAFTKFL